MSSYAYQKGRTAAPVRSTAPAAPRPISPAEAERIAANKDFILEHMPEMLPIIRELHAEGMIDGWRSVVRSTLLDGMGDE